MSTIKLLKTIDCPYTFSFSFSLTDIEVLKDGKVIFINMVIIINIKEEKGVVKINQKNFYLNSHQIMLINNWIDPKNDRAYQNNQRLFWMTPLILFTKLDHLNIVKYLLTLGCNPYVKVNVTKKKQQSVLDMKYINNKSQKYVLLYCHTQFSKDVINLINDYI